MKVVLTERDGARSSSIIGVLMEEYKEMTADIKARVELQQKNFNIFVVILTAVTGYLANYWTEHGTQGDGRGLATNAIALMIPAVPLIASMFVWRNSDHDANIVDKALYVDTVIRPRVIDATGDPHALGWEKFLREKRERRVFSVGMLAVVATEQLITLFLGAIYLGGSIYLKFAVDDYAGSAGGLYTVMTIAAFLALLWSAAGAVTFSRRYKRLGQRT